MYRLAALGLTGLLIGFPRNSEAHPWPSQLTDTAAVPANSRPSLVNHPNWTKLLTTSPPPPPPPPPHRGPNSVNRRLPGGRDRDSTVAPDHVGGRVRWHNYLPTSLINVSDPTPILPLPLSLSLTPTPSPTALQRLAYQWLNELLEPADDVLNINESLPWFIPPQAGGVGGLIDNFGRDNGNGDGDAKGDDLPRGLETTGCNPVTNGPTGKPVGPRNPHPNSADAKEVTVIDDDSSDEEIIDIENISDGELVTM
ncbi:hypothetical protein H4R33_001287 [Dimargaris cristalligena]|uniref:Uncharacterized protein n=1 Tax=Dimargaris cristalligena TaxID=215637 RepID=A0A4P9ZYL7_9FUNG|nr:hypothetical protein H4R33_001287 [Dimargaris cristalligena]RKP38836.1 hypothetical protein BJ085DRAFT_30837 [Dimargaris cristalligena]|eukprot:RKP38836.1 hypothetical protein BJ085DRAFT_30837 [Dimargaris cristalligena]